jgi:uncharacterized protein (DUF1778 family)
MPRPKTKRTNWQQSRAASALDQLDVSAEPVLKLSESASVAFAEFLLNPPAPNEWAIDAAKRYKEQFPAND